MLITYPAIDGYSISPGSVIATLMGDASADMVTDRVGSSPLNTLTENGTITYSTVANNSATLWASGFSAANYFSLPYTSALDPALNGFSHKIWFRTSISQSTNDTLLCRQSVTPAAGYYIYISSTGKVVTLVRDVSTHSAQSVASYNDGKSHCASTVFDGSTLKLYIDGKFVVSTLTGTLATLTNASAVLYLGMNWASGDPSDTTDIAGAEIEVGAQWTAQEIKNKYEKEKVLFNQLESFSIVGQNIDYETSILTSYPGNAVSDNSNETLNGGRSGLTWYRKKQYNCSVIPFARSSLPAATKFLKSTNNVPFTFDERGTSSASDNPITVYKTSNNEQIQYNNPYYNFSFSLKDA